VGRVKGVEAIDKEGRRTVFYIYICTIKEEQAQEYRNETDTCKSQDQKREKTAAYAGVAFSAGEFQGSLPGTRDLPRRMFGITYQSNVGWKSLMNEPLEPRCLESGVRQSVK
jgi:hypothetical protein